MSPGSGAGNSSSPGGSIETKEKKGEKGVKKGVRT